MDSNNKKNKAQLCSRRDFISASVATSAVALLPACSSAPGESAAGSNLSNGVSSANSWGEQWAIEGVANLSVESDQHILQVGTDVYPSDQRAAAFVKDQRFKDGRVEAAVSAQGHAAGVLLRRTSWRRYYFALYEPISGILDIRVKSPDGEQVLASTLVGALRSPLWLQLTASGTYPTRLQATVATESGTHFNLTAEDSSPELQAAGDAGVMATGDTLNPETHYPLGLPSGRAIFTHVYVVPLERETPISAVRPALYTALSTAHFNGIQISSDEPAGDTVPAVIAATTGIPLDGGARLSVATDVAAKVTFEIADNPDFINAFSIERGYTNRFNSAFADVTDIAYDQRVYWRPRLRRGDHETVGPTRSFQALPKINSTAPVKIALGTCATEFGPTFDHIAADQPDVFVWHGDLNYPDGAGPLAQNEEGYASIWKDFLATKELQPILSQSCFAPQRDDHDYGLNDCWKDTVQDFATDSWESTVNPDIYYSFKGGPVEVWVLDVRRYRDNPELPDDNNKSLVGDEQLRWLFEGLEASTAPFKIICSPTGVFNPPNNMGWGNGYTAERQKLLDHIEAHVNGRVVFISGDSHSPAAIEMGPYVEVRTSPLDIPHVGWASPSTGTEVLYSGQGKFYSLLEADGEGANAVLKLSIREVGLLGEGDTMRVSWESSYSPLNLS